MTLRLGLIGYALDRPGGGIARVTRGLLQALPGAGVTPILLETAPSGYAGPAVRLSGARLLPGLLTYGQVQVGLAARHARLDLLHDPSGTMPILFSPAPAVATLHDAIPFVQPQAATALDWLVYHFWLPLALRKASLILTPSRCSSADLQRWLKIPPRKITVIPLAAETRFHPIPLAECQPVLKRYGVEPPYILYVGSLEPRKNLLRLVQAFALLRQQGVETRLVIAGGRNAWKSSPVQQAVEQAGLEAWVRFIGYAADEDLPALYSAAEMLAFVSLYEGFGLPVLEAMACGTPVVTSNTSSLPEAAGEAALLVDPRDVEAICAALSRVLSEPGLKEALRQRGLERAAQFTWERTARLTVQAYRRALGGEAAETSAEGREADGVGE